MNLDQASINPSDAAAIKRDFSLFYASSFNYVLRYLLSRSIQQCIELINLWRNTEI